jgi:phage terminase small subunit
MALNPRRLRFIAEYLVDLNATQAAIRAGYSPKTARNQASELLAKPDIAAAVAEGRQKQIAKAEMDADEWRKLVAQIARGDMRRLVDPETGALIPVNELDDEAAASLASVEVSREKTRISKAGDAEVATEESLVKVKLWDRLRALDLMGRHLGLLKDKVEHTGENGGPVAVRFVDA